MVNDNNRLNKNTTAIKLPDDLEHEVLLRMLMLFPKGDARVKIYRRSLAELFEQYQKQLADMEETIRNYMEVASMIRGQKPVNNGLKYIHVRKKRRVAEDVS